MKISLVACAGMAVIFFPQSAINPAPLPIWWQKLGWTLVHSLWQMAIIAVLASVAVRLLHKRTAHVRYVVAISFLWLMVIAPAITWQTIGAVSPTDGPSIKVAGDDSKSILAPGKTIASNSGKPTDAGTDWQLIMLPAEDLPPRFDPNPAPSSRATQFPRLARTSPLFGGADRILSSFKPWLRHVVLAWLLGVALSCLRPVTGLWVQWQLRHHGLSAVTEDVQHLLNNLAKRMRLKCFVQVSESVIARAPMVVGYFNPLILLPASVLTGLTLDQLKSLLAHELAHIRRHDWIVNAIQVVIETLMFYHPAVWWLSNRIRNERELCCDDLAISVVQDKFAYGQMLLALEQMRPPVGFATAATGGDLVQRVRRLLPDHGVRARDNCGWLAGTIILLILITGLAGWSVTSTLASNSGSGTDIPAAERDSGDLDSAEQGAVSRPADKWTVVQGRIVVEGQTGIPAGLKLQRRITGGNFAEQVKDVEFNKLGEFSFEVPYDLAFVTVYATSTETAPGSSPRFEVRQGQPVDPLTIKLTRGFPAQLVLRSRDGSQPKSGVATVSLRNVFEPRLGSYPVTQQGKVTIPHCPSDQLQIDLWMPGFEEQRIYRSLSAVEATEVIVEPTPAARFQLVDSHGRPVPGANIRLFSRVRAGFFMSPRIQRESRPVWATSDDQGRVELTTLCKIDPMPTNMPGPAEYAFEINSPGLAPSYIGNVRAGSDLGRIVLSDSLSVQGQIIRDAQRPERVHVKWRQATVAQGTDAGKGDWTTATLEEKNGRLALNLSGLRPGPFDLFVTYSDASIPENEARSVLGQIEFHGLLMASSSDLKITSKTVVPGDRGLTAARASLFPIDEMPPSNLPETIVAKLLGQRTGRQNEVSDPGPSAAAAPLFYWEYTAPVQHSMGHVEWRLFVMQDGTVIVPGSNWQGPGTLHRLAPELLQEFKAFLEKHEDVWGKESPSNPPEFAGWRFGHESFVSVKNGQSRQFLCWDTYENLKDSNLELRRNQMTEFLMKFRTEITCGGRAAMRDYRDLANKALKSALPTAVPFAADDTCWASIDWDGTREIDFSRTSESLRVTLVHPIGEQPFIKSINMPGKRAAQLPVAPKRPPVPVADSSEQARVDDLSPLRITGTVNDADQRPIPNATVVLMLQKYQNGEHLADTVARATADSRGDYELPIPGAIQGTIAAGTQAIVWAIAENFGAGIVQIRGTGPDQSLSTVPLLPARTIHVQILDPNGGPADGELMLNKLDHLVPSEFQKQMVVSQGDGHFELRKIPDSVGGDEEQDYSPRLREVRFQSRTLGHQRFLWRTDTTAIREKEEPVKLTAQPLVKVKGRLVSQGDALPEGLISGVPVTVVTFTGEPTMKTPWVYGHATAKTDLGGQFEIDVPAGKIISLTGGFPESIPWRVVLEDPDLVAQPDAAPFLNVPVTRLRLLRGRVLDQDNKGVPNVEFGIAHGAVKITRETNFTSTKAAYRNTCLTDQDGRFSIPLIPGDVSIHKRFMPGSDMVITLTWPRPDSSADPGANDLLTLPAGLEPFDLPPIAVTIYRGTLLDAAGRPVKAALMAHENKRAIGMGQSAADGTFSIETLGHAEKWLAGRLIDQGNSGFPSEPVTVESAEPFVLRLGSETKPEIQGNAE